MIGKEEEQAVLEVIRSGVLSDYMGVWGDKFMGGPQVQALEKEWSDYFGVKHSVAMNSATSGLYAAMGAIGIQPGDEVIVSPYTMVASATAPLVYGGVPVFADIDEDIFCISAQTIAPCITEKTKAIIVVDLFGHPADIDEIMALAEHYGIMVIEDAAQAPGAKYKGRYAGTLGHIGVYSLNYHKTIHCGEGGVVVTNDDELARRLQLIRNHGEVVVGPARYPDHDIIGYNYRLTEIQAAIARVQLGKLEKMLVKKHMKAFEYNHTFDMLAGFELPTVRDYVHHGWYLYALKTPGFRKHAVNILQQAGFDAVPGYVRPIYQEPIFRQYAPEGGCPVTERMHYDELVYIKIDP